MSTDGRQADQVVKSGLHSLSVLLGLLGGLVGGGALGAFAGWEHAMPEPTVVLDAGHATGPRVDSDPAPRASDTGWPRTSYAQQGEDIVVRSIFDALKVPRPSYIDIGAYHPLVNNNTYLLYRGGSRGVLVEPNPAFTEMLKSKRPGDRVLAIGIGVSEDSAADYYVFEGPGQDNTFSKAQADELVRQHGPSAVRAVMKVPLRNINHVLDEEFPAGGPDFFSIDIEGMDLQVLQSLDFKRHRPKVFCVETTALGVAHVDQQILSFMKQKDYEQRGGNLVNSIFVDRTQFAR